MLKDPCHGACHHVRGDSGSSRQRLVVRARIWILPYRGPAGPGLPAAGPPAPAPRQPPRPPRRRPPGPRPAAATRPAAPTPRGFARAQTPAPPPRRLYSAPPTPSTRASRGAHSRRSRHYRRRPPAPLRPPQARPREPGASGSRLARGHAPQPTIGVDANLAPPLSLRIKKSVCDIREVVCHSSVQKRSCRLGPTPSPLILEASCLLATDWPTWKISPPLTFQGREKFKAEVRLAAAIGPHHIGLQLATERSAWG
jgi:hypothetical protein